MILPQIIQATWEVVVASATWLIFGFLIAGVLHVLLPTKLIRRYLMTPGWGSVVRASALGVPLPLCSCSVIPVAVALRRQGASRGAMASFLVSTPEIGVDSFLLSYFLLGPLLAVMRVIAAFFSALGVGSLVDWLYQANGEDMASTKPIKGETPAPHSCCAAARELSTEAEKSCDCEVEKTGTCAEHSDVAIIGNVWSRVKEVLRYAFVDIVDDLALMLLIGFFLAGVIAAVLPPTFFQDWGWGVYSGRFLMLFISLPLYVCATSSTPLAAVLLAKGLDPGAVVIFMLAGPASNITTMLAVLRDLGGRALAAYLIVVAMVSLLTSFLIDALPKTWLLSGIESDALHHGAEHGGMGTLGALILLLLMGLSFYRELKSKKKDHRCCSQEN